MSSLTLTYVSQSTLDNIRAAPHTKTVPFNHSLPSPSIKATMSPSPQYILSLTTLIYYAPCAPLLLYILWTHRHTGISGWKFFFLFTALQCTGAGLAVGSGANGTPSATSIILTQVGLSPLILGLEGVVYEYFKLSHPVEENVRKTARWLHIFFILAVMGAVAFYAAGAVELYGKNPPSSALAEVQAGATCLLAFFLALCATFGAVAWRTRETQTARPLMWSVTVSLALLAIRVVFSTVSAFDHGNPAFNPVTGSIAYQNALEFVPGALIIAVMAVGGLMTANLGMASTRYVPVEVGRLTEKRTSDECEV